MRNHLLETLKETPYECIGMKGRPPLAIGVFKHLADETITEISRIRLYLMWTAALSSFTALVLTRHK